MSTGQTAGTKKPAAVIKPRFSQAAAMMMQHMLGTKKEPTNDSYVSVSLGHKIGSIMSHAAQRRAAKKRRNIRARSKMNKK